MKSDKIFSKNDCDKIFSLFNNYPATDETEKKLIETLKQQIMKSEQADAEKIDKNFVTVDSRILLRNIGNGSGEIYHLVLPDDSDLKRKKISIFSGIGSQILGSRIGTVIKENASSEKYFMIEDILLSHELSDS